MNKAKTSEKDKKANKSRNSSAESDSNDQRYLLNASQIEESERSLSQEQLDEKEVKTKDKTIGSRLKTFCWALAKFAFVAASVLKIKLFL